MALKVDPRHGRSTGQADLPTRHPGSNVRLLLGRLEGPLLGSSDLEATAATANTTEEGTAALRRGNNPEVVTTAMAGTEVDTVGTVAAMEEAMDMEGKVHPLAAQLLAAAACGLWCSRHGQLWHSAASSASWRDPAATAS